MKNKIIFTATAVLLLCVGIGMFLYASSNNSTTITAFSTEEVADNTETVSSPPEVSCTAYVFRVKNADGHDVYKVSTTTDVDGVFIESREGTYFDCPTCPSQCSAFYELCDEYGVEYDY